MMKALPTILSFLAVLGTMNSYSQDGSLDPDFGGGDGMVSTSFYANQRSQAFGVAVQNDNKIVVSGYTRAPDGKEYAILMRYQADGQLDNGFNGNGKVIIPPPYGLASSRKVIVQPDQKIIMVLASPDTVDVKLGLYRFLENGVPDNTFDADGEVHTSWGVEYISATALTLQPDGKILVGGYIGLGNDLIDQFYVARYLTNGIPDPSFDGDGIVITTVGENYTHLNEILVQSDGKIIAVGQGYFNGSDDYAVVRYNEDGSLDPSFSDDGIASVSLSTGEDRAMGGALQPDSKIVLGGYSRNVATGRDQFSAVRLNHDGTLDDSFHGTGKVIIPVTDDSDGGYTLLRQPDGKIVLGGYVHSASTSTWAALAIVRLDNNGVLDTSFDGDGVGIYPSNNTSSGIIHAMALQPDGKLIAAGIILVDDINTVGVIRINTGLTTSVADPDIAATEVELFPNPITAQAHLQYELQKDENITITLNDLQGRLVQRLLPGTPRTSGSHSEKLVIHQSLPPGIYLVSLQSERWIKSMKVVVE